MYSTAGLYLSNFNKGGRLSARPEGPTLEARRAESGGGVLGRGQRAPSPWRGQRAPPHQLGGWGSAVSSPSGVRAGKF